MYLHKDDIIKILELFEKFPDVEVAEILQDHSSGIGAHTTMNINTTVNGVMGKLELVVSSVETW